MNDDKLTAGGSVTPAATAIGILQHCGGHLDIARLLSNKRRDTILHN